jgi:hypothetical protein
MHLKSIQTTPGTAAKAETPQAEPDADESNTNEALLNHPLITNAPRLKLERKSVFIGSLRPGTAPSQVRAKLGRPKSISEEAPYQDANSDGELPSVIWHYEGLSITFLDKHMVEARTASHHWPRPT